MDLDKWYILCAVAALVFKNKSREKFKLKNTVKLSEQKNCGNAHHKYAIRGLNRHLPYAVSVAVNYVLSFRYWYVTCLKISSIWKWNWKLTDNHRNKRKSGVLIVNMLFWDQTVLTLFCCCQFCSLFVNLTVRLNPTKWESQQSQLERYLLGCIS